jgi:hypothetical protein
VGEQNPEYCQTPSLRKIRPLRTELELALEKETHRADELELKLSTIKDFFRGTSIKV